jgi:hypothetical protein
VPELSDDQLRKLERIRRISIEAASVIKTPKGLGTAATRSEDPTIIGMETCLSAHFNRVLRQLRIISAIYGSRS